MNVSATGAAGRIRLHLRTIASRSCSAIGRACCAAGRLVLSMAPAGHCEALFREFGGMHPSATALGNLSKGLGPVLEVVEEDALETIRGQEAVPVEARALAISIDGVHVGMRKEKVARGQGVASVPAGFREASSGTVSLFDGDGERLRTAYHGRMPEAGKATLKRDVLAEAQHWMNLRPDLEVVFIADGAADNWTSVLHCSSC